jgi:superfamily I DNA/RNA helicase
MNWRLSALDGFALVSNSDAHSPGNIGREANIFKTGLSYPDIRHALRNKDSGEFFGTIEFFPEEGKYHYDGHRDCKVSFNPAQTLAAGGICPVCGGRITLGVLHRVEALADREEGAQPPAAKHYESLVPLNEVIAASIGFTVNSRKVKDKYEDLLRNLGGELFILREASLSDIELAAGPQLAEGIRRLRAGRVEIEPGYDGVYGKIRILNQSEREELSGQLSFFHEKTESLPDKANQNAGGGGKRAIAKAVADESQDEEESEAAVRAASDAVAPGTAGAVENAAGADLYNGLNKEQWEAVSSTDSAIAIIAGPGTGKTKTLVSRIAYLVEQRGIAPGQITAVTFTNKAAAEMRRRLNEHFAGKGIAEEITIGTFHSICLQLLSKQRDKVVIIDEYEAVSIIEGLLKETGEKSSPRQTARAISLLKNGGRRVGRTQSGEKETPPFSIENGAIQAAGTADVSSGLKQMGVLEGLPQATESAETAASLIYNAYCSRLKEYGVMDFDDILLETLDLLEMGEPPRGEEAGEGAQLSADRNHDYSLRNTSSDHFNYLLVDEFQDINEVQYRLLQAWSRGSENIFVIGDPDQAIYGFRGSDSRFFARFQQDFSVKQPIRLTKNYRSTPQIISVAASLIAGTSAASAPSFLQPVRAGGAAVRLVETGSEFSEALFISKEINRLVGGIDMLAAGAKVPSAVRSKKHAVQNTAAAPDSAADHPRSFSEMAILYRTNRQAEMLEQCLQQEGIPYRVAGRGEFMADKPVREALAFFRYLLNPADLLSLRAVLRSGGNLSSVLQREIMKNYLAGEQSITSLIKIMNSAAAAKKTEAPGLTGPDLAHLLAKYNPMIKKAKPAEIIEHWISDNNLAGLKSMENLAQTAIMYDHFYSFLHSILLGQEGDLIRSGGKKYQADAVTLMTMHGAKGLEFPLVFLCGLNEGLVPLDAAATAEEKRLLYVGMTRAKDELILLTSGKPSPFLSALPPDELSRDNASGGGKKGKKVKQTSLFD